MSSWSPKLILIYYDHYPLYLISPWSPKLLLIHHKYPTSYDVPIKPPQLLPQQKKYTLKKFTHTYYRKKYENQKQKWKNKQRGNHYKNWKKKKRIKQKHFYCFVFAKTQNIRLISHTHFNIKNNKKTQIRKIYII